jgi:hypothetical protein
MQKLKPFLLLTILLETMQSCLAIARSAKIV